jgi:hypothetical protein|tara:strand:- start:285 stop:404 length:120 start_codon:yes stop_codon:yes gene_type:complete
MDVQLIATEIYELFYEHQMYPIDDLQEYWNFKEDLDEDE